MSFSTSVRRVKCLKLVFSSAQQQYFKGKKLLDEITTRCSYLSVNSSKVVQSFYQSDFDTPNHSSKGITKVRKGITYV
jgi:hypothetical protein